MKLKLKKIIFLLFFIVVQEVLAQAPVSQFWQLNKSPLKQLEPLNDLVWDNKWFNQQIDNGNGNWNLTAANWSPNIKNNVRWIPCRNAIFGGDTGTGIAGNVSISGTMSAQSLYFKPGNGNFVLQGGGGITSAPCGMALRLDVSSGLSPYIFIPITGATALNKENAGKAFLLGTNTYTGTTTVNEGILSVGAYGDNMKTVDASLITAAKRNPLVLPVGFNGVFIFDGSFYTPVYLPAVTANDGDVIYFSKTSSASIFMGIERTNVTAQLAIGGVQDIWYRFDGLSKLWIFMGDPTDKPSIRPGSNVIINSQGTMQWDNNNSTTVYSIANIISGMGTLILKGQNASDALQTSWYQLTGNNTAYSGNLIINRAMLRNNANPSNLGTSAIKIQDRGTILFNGGTFGNIITIEDKAGWHTSLSDDIVIGAIRLEGSNTLNGNIVLNNPTNTVLGDGTGQYAAIGGYNAGTHTLNGVISGNGNLSMSRFTGYNGGTPEIVNIKLTGTASNTFIGKTVINGQGSNANLLLMKTGGAVAIPANTIVEMGNNTNGLANLRIGDDQNTGATIGTTRNQWDNQFGDAVLMNFKNASGDWMRFDLQGTNQTLAGIVCGNETTQGGGIIQNQNFNGFDINNPATLTLNVTATYVFNGLIRDQESGVGTVNKLNIVKNGSGIQTFIGNNSYSGNTTINQGVLKAGNVGAFGTSIIILNVGGTLDKGGFVLPNTIINNGGTIIP